MGKFFGAPRVVGELAVWSVLGSFATVPWSPVHEYACMALPFFLSRSVACRPYYSREVHGTGEEGQRDVS